MVEILRVILGAAEAVSLLAQHWQQVQQQNRRVAAVEGESGGASAKHRVLRARQWQHLALRAQLLRVRDGDILKACTADLGETGALKRGRGVDVEFGGGRPRRVPAWGLVLALWAARWVGGGGEGGR
jgi:hypothetical protein